MPSSPVGSNSIDAGTRTSFPLRTIAIASLGGALEFYDFIVFVYFADAIGSLFFPATLPVWARTIQVFSLFAAGYLARPLGGVLMGRTSDMLGHKRMFVVSVMLMAIPSLMIGMAPTFQTVGFAAPLFVLICRVVQGAAIGGEAPIAWVYAFEHASRRHAGLACGLLTSGLTCGILLGSIVTIVVHAAYSQTEVLAFGWRIPFLLGGVFGILGVLLRRRLAETPVFEAMQLIDAGARRRPVKHVLRQYWGAVIVSMLATWQLTAVIVVLILMAPTFMKMAGAEHGAALLANLAATVALTFGCIATGLAIDWYGLPKIVLCNLIAMPAVLYLVFPEIGDTPMLVMSSLLIGGLAGTIVMVPCAIVRSFPAGVRASGAALSYNVAYAIAGGVTPPLAIALWRLDPRAPALYVACVTVVGSAAILFWHWTGRLTPFDVPQGLPGRSCLSQAATFDDRRGKRTRLP